MQIILKSILISILISNLADSLTGDEAEYLMGSLQTSLNNDFGDDS